MTVVVNWVRIMFRPTCSLDDLELTRARIDPHGADKLGNPVGGLVYSSALPSGDNSTLQQVVRWTMFYDGNLFCLKICDPTNTGGSDLCFNECVTVIPADSDRFV